MNGKRKDASGIGSIGLIGLLISRLILFAFFQAMIALWLHSWQESVKYWLLTATLTNIVSIILLLKLFNKEGITYFSIFQFRKLVWKKDLTIFLGLAALSLITLMVPAFYLEKWFWGNTDYYQAILFQPIPHYIAYILLIVFPLTIAFAELATYFGYIMPRLKQKISSKSLFLILPVMFLSLQHCTLPLVFDFKFIIFRALVYLPFALFIGISLNKRPALLPYFAILHGLLDLMTVVMLLGTMGN